MWVELNGKFMLTV